MHDRPSNRPQLSARMRVLIVGACLLVVLVFAVHAQGPPAPGGPPGPPLGRSSRWRWSPGVGRRGTSWPWWWWWWWWRWCRDRVWERVTGERGLQRRRAARGPCSPRSRRSLRPGRGGLCLLPVETARTSDRPFHGRPVSRQQPCQRAAERGPPQSLFGPPLRRLFLTYGVSIPCSLQSRPNDLGSTPRAAAASEF